MASMKERTPLFSKP